MVMPVNVAPNPQSERAQTTETPCSEPKTRFGEYPGIKQRSALPKRNCKDPLNCFRVAEHNEDVAQVVNRLLAKHIRQRRAQQGLNRAAKKIGCVFRDV